MRFYAVLRAGIASLLAIVLVGAALPSDTPDEVVARVGDDYIVTFDDVKSYVDSRPLYAMHPDRREAYRKALDEIVDAQVKRMDFFDRGLQRDEELLQGIQRSITEELVVAYFDKKYLSKYVNEEAIREAYEKAGRQVVYREIVVRKPRGAAPEVLDSIRATVGRIHSAVNEGVSFDELIQKYTQDPRAARTGGYGEPVTWHTSMSTPFGRAVFNLEPGQIRAFETGQAFRIVRVERIDEQPPAPLDSVRRDISKKLHGYYAELAQTEFEREKEAIIDSSAASWNQEALRHVLRWSNTPNFYERDYKATLQRFLAGGANMTIVTFDDREVDVAEFLHLLEDVLIMRSSGGHTLDGVKSFLLEAVRSDVLAQRARELGLEEELMRLDSPSSVLRKAFVRLYNQRMIEEQIPEANDQALRAFFEQQRDSLFYQLATVRAYAIVRSSRDDIEEIWSAYEAGTPFRELSHRRLVQSFIRTREGKIEPRAVGQEPYLGEAVFQLQPDEVAGPIEFKHPDEGTQYAILKGISRLDERPLRYDEVEDTIAETFAEYHRERVSAAVVRDLREKFQVTIYDDVLERNLAVLAQR